MASARIVRTLLVLALFVIVFALADSEDDHKSKHIKIHAPLPIKFIHHHQIIKVPVVMRKHIHHHKHFSHENIYIPLKHKPKAVYLEDAGGEDDGGEHGKKTVIIKKALIPASHLESGGGNGGYQVNEHSDSEGDEESSDYSHGSDRIDYGSYEFY